MSHAHPHQPQIEIGISKAHREQIAKGLSNLLADTYILYTKAQAYHWNITGPHFHTLHVLFEEQYTELALAIDQIAERIRALGHWAPAGLEAYRKLSKIPDPKAGGTNTTEELVKDLMTGHEAIIQTSRGLFPAVDNARDEATADLLTQRMQIHEKAAWMLRAILTP